ncbi:MAG: hypothetical protein NT009_03525 [Proteobacteria bacterium]|nr:hypothetical protein [Pseudomonadota bacterium]
MGQPVSIEELKGYAGKVIGGSEWFEVAQERINAFAPRISPITPV